MALVTKDGFAAAALALEEKLATADFVAVDCEMTGITDNDLTKPQINDTPSLRYSKCSKIASKFQLMQVGVCPFHSTEDGKHYVGTPFTFYVLPDAKANSPLLMYTSTAAFHASCDFDFNAWLKGGVPFLSEAAYAATAEKLSRTEEPPREKRERVVISADSDKVTAATEPSTSQAAAAAAAFRCRHCCPF